MLGKPRSLCDGAHRVVHLRREGIQRAIEARRHEGHDHPGLALETLGAAIQKRDDRARVRLPRRPVHHVVERGVHPSPRRDVVQARDDKVEPPVERLIVVLDLATIRRYLDAQMAQALVHERGCDLGLGSAYVPLPEQELTVQVRDVNRVHVYDVDVSETRESEVLQHLAAETTSTDHEDLALLAEVLHAFRTWLECIGVRKGALSRQ
mmetsp:Transcript_102123/g.288409  ORF Transcript_102123/g.288409 Transcript_102123/m.288409 type:complete len:208 (+) Transcript_102123:745-1368(+)